MHTKYYKVALAMAAGISLGAAAVEGLHAQAKRAGYVVAELNNYRLASVGLSEWL